MGESDRMESAAYQLGEAAREIDTLSAEITRLTEQRDARVEEVDALRVEVSRLMGAEASALAERDVLREACEALLCWIDNWSPAFTEDPEWPVDSDAARAAIEKARTT